MKTKTLLTLLLLFSFSAQAEGLSEHKDGELARTYEGSIRGMRALMKDLQEDQPGIYRKLETQFEDLDKRQSRADVILWTTYGISTALTVYGFATFFSASTGGSSFTPFLLAIGASSAGTLGYIIARPSAQEYMDFTNRHNKLNPKRQLEWKLSFLPGGGQAQVGWNF